MIIENHQFNKNDHTTIITEESKKNENNTIITKNEQIIPILQFAVEKGNLDVFQLLLVNPSIDVNESLKCKCTQITTYKDKPEEFDLIESNKEESALYAAIKNQKLELIRLLLYHEKIDLNKQFVTLKTKKLHDFNESEEIKKEKSILHVAVHKEYPEIIDQLIKCKDLDINSIYKVHKQMKSKNERAKLHNNFKEIYQEKTALTIAIEKNNINIVNQLLSNTSLNVSQYLLTHEIIDTNENNENNDFLKTETKSQKNSVHLAIEKGNKSIVQALLNLKTIDYNCCSKWSQIISNHKEIISNIKQIKPLLIIAVENQNKEIIQCLLLNENISVNEKTITYNKMKKEKKYKSALHIAIEKGNSDIISLLLENKAEIDISNNC